MKIQIVHLAAHDDVISTRDKMGWGQTSRILLVWPEKGKVLDRPLDLILLQRHSQSIGSQLSLVTRDEIVIFHAEQLGIPTFPTLRKAQSSRRGVGSGGRRRRMRRKIWARDPSQNRLRSQSELLEIRAQARLKPAAWQYHPATRWGALALSLLALLALAVVIIPGSSISIQPRQKIQSMTLPITASLSYSSPKLTGEVPARWSSVIVEARGTTPTTGEVMVADKSAAGTVVFTNLTSQPVMIPKGTVVRTIGADAQQFITTLSGKVAAGAGKFLEIPIQALSPGTRGNVAAHTIRAVEEDLASKVSCTNQSPLKGGKDRSVRGPSKADRETLYQNLFEDLEASALQQVSPLDPGLIGEEDFPILSSLKFVQVLEERYEPTEGIPAEDLVLTLRLEFKVLVMSGWDVLSVVEPILTASVPDGFSVLANTLKMETKAAPVMVGAETARFEIVADQTIQAVIQSEKVVQGVRGLPINQAAAQLFAALPLAQEPLIRVFPAWWPYLPLTTLRITVN
ncbi:MAG: baseplate J/gp47 family protein [Anaerolineales bacterium]|jgi:hypothetical protein|nr:baseplate J/gp47 family protein [Anaerolineales bacterium]